MCWINSLWAHGQQTSAPLPPAASCRHKSPYPEPAWHPAAPGTHPAAAASAASSRPFLCPSPPAGGEWCPAPETGRPPGPLSSPHGPPAGPDRRIAQLVSVCKLTKGADHIGQPQLLTTNNKILCDWWFMGKNLKSLSDLTFSDILAL